VVTLVSFLRHKYADYLYNHFLMKNKLALLFCIFSSMAILPVYSQADSLSIKPLIVQDSSFTSSEWTTKKTLSPELQQQRADNRAEVESMKRRFRAFHQQTSVQEKKIEEEQDFLWSEAEESTTNITQTNKNKASSSTNTEEMRMQINRSFQREAISTTPDWPANKAPEVYNFDNNNTISPKGGQPTSIETAWENDAFQSNNATKVNWQLNLDPNRKNDIPFDTFKEGNVINMELNFENRSSVLSPVIKMRLNEWIALFTEYPGIKIEIRAHTHHGIPYTEALELTTQRARAVIDYFTASGMAASQLNFKGYGNLSPLFSSSDTHNQEKNERIELIILELPKR